MFGHLQPGTKLKIEMLQQLYRCGATPVREALGLLCSTGMVERIDQRGFRVSPVSLADYTELMRTRCFAEEQALREAIQHGTADWEEAIVVARFHLQKAATPAGEGNFSSIKTWEDRHAVFHATLISASPSKRLLAFCAQLYDESNRYRYIARHGAGGRAGSFEEHQRIAEMVLQRDSDRAVGVLLDHYRRTADILEKALGSPAALRPGPALAEACQDET